MLLILLACGGDPSCGGDEPGIDQDGDGSPAALDCDDGDPGRHPGASEACDGVDSDCDGLDDLEDPDVDTTACPAPLTGLLLVSDADAVLHGSWDSASSGEVLPATGDLDGDGIADVLVYTGTDGATEARLSVVPGTVRGDVRVDLAAYSRVTVGVTNARRRSWWRT